MKKRLFPIAVLLVGFVVSLSAQRYDNNYSANVDYRYQYRNSSYQNNSWRAYDGRQANRIVQRMSQRDRKRLSQLERKYRQTERRAWENGSLSRRERQKLDRIQRDINNLFRKYERRNNSRNNNRGRNGCPGR